ncbi:MAG TPA: universal stress protein [Anaerolineales bacterium]|nr:universal stress protein [Anaerolineales bacterium]
MYKRILVPLDGSSSSEEVFKHVVPLTQAFDAEMILLQVLLEPAEEFAVPTSPLSPPIGIRKLQTKTRAYLKKVCAKLEKEGTRVSYLIRQGGVAERILEVAEVMEADLIAMSSHGHSPTRVFLLGSVTYQVVRHSALPVLVTSSETSIGQVH